MTVNFPVQHLQTVTAVDEQPFLTDTHSTKKWAFHNIATSLLYDFQWLGFSSFFLSFYIGHKKRFQQFLYKKLDSLFSFNFYVMSLPYLHTKVSENSCLFRRLYFLSYSLHSTEGPLSVSTHLCPPHLVFPMAPSTGPCEQTNQ